MDPRRNLIHAIATALIGIVCAGLAVPAARAELIYFRKGGDAQIPATIEGNHVVLAMPDGKFELARDDIRKLVPGFWPAGEWEARLQKSRELGVEARFAAAWWAIENGLTTEVAAELREIHRLDPKHAAVGADGRRAGSARAAVFRSRFHRVSKGARDRGQRGAWTARDPVPPAFRRRGKGADRISWSG